MKAPLNVLHARAKGNTKPQGRTNMPAAVQPIPQLSGRPILCRRHAGQNRAPTPAGKKISSMLLHARRVGRGLKGLELPNLVKRQQPTQRPIDTKCTRVVHLAAIGAYSHVQPEADQAVQP